MKHLRQMKKAVTAAAMALMLVGSAGTAMMASAPQAQAHGSITVCADGVCVVIYRW